MSWSVDIEIVVRKDVRDVTYNNGRILRFLGIHPTGKEDLKLGEWKTLLGAANLRLNTLTDEDTKSLLEMEPENKWGGVEDVKKFISLTLERIKEVEQEDQDALTSGKLVWS